MHTEKQKIFDEYAKSVSSLWTDFDDLLMTNVRNGNVEFIKNHFYNACDLVQKEQQNRISENAKVYNGTESEGSFTYMNDLFEDIGVTVCNDSILSEKNIIK